MNLLKRRLFELGFAGLFVFLLASRGEAGICGNGVKSIMGEDTASGVCSEIGITNKRLQTDAVVTGLLQQTGALVTVAAAQTVDFDLAAAATNLRVFGFTVRESAGTPAVATVAFRHDVAAGGCTGNAFAIVELAANTSQTFSFGDRGIAAPSGLCVDVLAGEVDADAWTAVEASSVVGVGALVAVQAAKTADFDLAAATANQRLLGYTIRESAGTPAVATAVLRHDVAAGGCTGNAFAYVELAANSSTTFFFGDRGAGAASGICVDVLAGEVDADAWTIVE